MKKMDKEAKETPNKSSSKIEKN